MLAQQLRQLLINLLTNAFEAAPAHGAHVEVKAAAGPSDTTGQTYGEEPRSTVVIDVVDNGPGIPDDVKERIFSPFFTTKPRGSGLGLAIVRKIVDAHDGQIDVIPQKGGGTCVRVTLPTRSLQDAPEAGTPAAAN